MVDEDFIFRFEGVDGGQIFRVGFDGDFDVDSDDDEGYFICFIIDDFRLYQNVNFKVNNYYSNLMKSEQYSFSGLFASFFYFKVSGLFVLFFLFQFICTRDGELGSLVRVFFVQKSWVVF